MANNKLKFVRDIWKAVFNAKGFGCTFKDVVITSADEKRITAEFTVTEEMSNFGGTLHGGATATIADMVSSLGLLCIEGNTKAGASVTLSVNYLRAAKIGEEVLLESTVSKFGKTLAYLDITLKKKSTGDIVATCSHVKHLGTGVAL